MTKRDLAYNIKRIRQNLNFTQEHVADKLAMTASNYSKLENGKIKLTYETLNQIAVIFGVTVKAIEEYENRSFLVNNTINNQRGQAYVTQGQHNGLSDKDVYERLLAEKDRMIADREKQLEVVHQERDQLWGRLMNLLQKAA